MVVPTSKAWVREKIFMSSCGGLKVAKETVPLRLGGRDRANETLRLGRLRRDCGVIFLVG
jgi:hypothetical protein